MTKSCIIYLDGSESVYEIYSNGRVLNTVTNKYLKPIKNKSTGYLGVSLRSHKGTVHYKLIHRLVAEAFIPNELNKRTVNHIDGNKSNNDYTNLEWATDYENVNDAWNRGCCSSRKGEHCNLSKHTDDQIHKVCKLLSDKVPLKNISIDMDIPKHIIRDILFYDGWKHISSKYDIDINIYRRKPSVSFDNITKERINLLYEENPNITPKLICKQLGLSYNDDSRRAIYKLKNISNSSTTIERDEDKYYYIDI